MAKDETEDARRAQQARINAAAETMTKEELRRALEAVHGVGNVWDRDELDAVRKRLYTEKTLNGDEMRDLAHKLTIVLDHTTKETE